MYANAETRGPSGPRYGRAESQSDAGGEGNFGSRLRHTAFLVADDRATIIRGQGGQFQNALSPIPSTRNPAQHLAPP